MRFDVHKIRVHLVNELMETPQVKEVWHDGSDVVILDFKTGESVAIHLVERYISINEIEYLFAENARQGYYTILILWADMFMPSDGQVYQADDWMLALLELYGGKIYGYDAWRHAPHIFEVGFTRVGTTYDYMIKHNSDVNIGHIGVETVETNLPNFKGFWRVGRFDGFDAKDEDSYWEDNTTSKTGYRPTMGYYFKLLGIASNADRAAVKRAYRAMALKHHPDVNPHEDTTRRMQQINDAYTRITRYLDDEDARTAS